MSNGPDGHDLDVLVIGAGPTGLTAACELRRHGVACRIIDGDEGPTPPHESRALGIWERTQEVFATLGVIDRFLGSARRLHGLNAYADGKRLVHFDLDQGDGDSAYTSTLILPQGQTERILIDRLGALGGAVDWKTRSTGLTQDAAGVSVTLAGPDGVVTNVRSRWVVGCDGARSDVRHALGLAFEGSEYAEAFLLADGRVDWPLPDDEAHMFLQSTGGGFGAFPLPEAGRWRLIDTTGAVMPTDPAGVAARLVDLMHDSGYPSATMTDVSWTSSFRIHRRLAERFRAGRVFVAGDAAHVHSPAGGQGMNTGIQDAHNLAWKLALAARGRAGAALLDSYDAERRPVAASVLRNTDAITRAVTLRGEVPRQVRDRLLGLVGDLGFVRRRAARRLSELDVSYRSSPVVAEDRAGLWSALSHADWPALRGALDFGAAPHPGDRAPDVALTDAPLRLHDALADPRHALLLFPGAPGPTAALADAAALVRARYADLVRVVHVDRGGTAPAGADALPDPGGALHSRYGAAGPCLYLIRPDGHVGYRSRPPDAAKLGAYLDRIFTGA